MSFNDLPPEIYDLICIHLPQESRRNLILVNKYFYQVAIPTLYNTVYLPTRRRVISFQDSLFHHPHLSAHVRHLLVSDRNRDEFHVTLPDFIVYWPQTHAERMLRRQRIREWLMDRDKELSFFRSALGRILALVSGHLRSLALLYYEHSIKTLRDMLNFKFPVLEELTIRGDYPPLPRTLYLPKLKRLHLAAGDIPNPWASFSSLTSGCPNLTHLRITEPLSCILSGSVLAHAFEVAFGLARYDPETLAMPLERNPDGTMHFVPAPCLPPNLVELRLQPYPPEISTMGSPYPDHTDMIERLKAIEARSKIFKLLPSNNENYVLPYSFDAARHDWENRMAGGPGCWADPRMPSGVHCPKRRVSCTQFPQRLIREQTKYSPPALAGSSEDAGKGRDNSHDLPPSRNVGGWSLHPSPILFYTYKRCDSVMASKGAAVALDFSRIYSKLGLGKETIAALNAFRKRYTDAKRIQSTLQSQPTEVDFEHYRSVLKNKAIVDEAEKTFKNFKPVTYDVSSHLKAIEAFEAKAIENAKATEAKIEEELKDLEATLANIEKVRPFEELTVEDVGKAHPEIVKAVETMMKKGKWTVPGYKEKFGDLSLM